MPGWLLFTWTTFGSWLPGDPRGFRTRNEKYIPPPKRYAKPGEKTYEADEYAKLYEHFKEKVSQVYLNGQQIYRAAQIANEIIEMRAYISIGRDHVHLLVEDSGINPAAFMNRIKGRISFELGKLGLPGKVWAAKYHVRRIAESEFESAKKYVMNHSKEGHQTSIIFPRKHGPSGPWSPYT